MISKTERKRFRTIGHTLKPIVTIAGNGLSDSVLNELDRALEDHELIKVKINAENREDRSSTVQQITEQTNTHLVQRIGNVALIYKAAVKPNPKLSNVMRSRII